MRRLELTHPMSAFTEADIAARNMLDRAESYTWPPFFWSRHLRHIDRLYRPC